MKGKKILTLTVVAVALVLVGILGLSKLFEMAGRMKTPWIIALMLK